ncbi:MurR/RpiR family transcriptional regulator [Lactiplantibacillus modestisalitolerans]|uniref:MurR/RpiR family transcriptional regulator n=1 Tax=Lactiplantibacillus modestisalitolerans TaxID=1457219 RepID=A0ABV5WUH9_9LACO|nr:MurR/RpiR family transcriptional regulator [Lactiplantibacillus modestisalitolerans]
MQGHENRHRNRVLTLIRSYYPNLSATDRKVADHIIADPVKTAAQSISDLAAAVGVSTATVSRFVKRISFQSFREFSRELTAAEPLEQANAAAFQDVEQQTTFKGIADSTFNSIRSSLDQTSQVMTEDDLQRAVHLLLNARTIGFYGLGGSAVAALDGYHKFVRTGITCVHNSDYDMQLMQAAQMTPKDVAVVISHTGRNQQTLKLLDTLLAQGVPVITLTSFGNSPLAKGSTVAFISVAEEVNYRSEGLTSLIAQMSIIDSLFLMTAVHGNIEMAASLERVRDAISTTRTDI